MKVGIRVGDVMTKNIISVDPETPVKKCAKLMSTKHIGSLLVMKKEKLQGILTEGDIIKAIGKGLALDLPVKKIMTRKVITIKPSSDIYDALVLMKKKRIRWLPVVVKEHLVGFLTEKDILKIQPDLFDIAIQNVRIAEEEEKWKRIRAIDEYKWVKEGPCQECGAYDLLYKVGNRYLCATCRKKEEGLWEE